MSTLDQFAIGQCNCGNPGWTVVCVTCTPAGLPTVFAITDANGTNNATWNGTAWRTGNLSSASISSVVACTSGTINCASYGAGAAGYWYQISCSNTNQLTVARYWQSHACGGVGILYLPPTGGCSGNLSSSTAAVAISCSAPAGSGIALTLTGGYYIADPVGGTVSFTP